MSAAAVAWIVQRGRRRAGFPDRPRWPRLAFTGALGLAGDLAYAAAAQHGALAIISAISSLYPVPTIALGRLLQGKRATAIQLTGAALALAGAAIVGTTSS